MSGFLSKLGYQPVPGPKMDSPSCISCYRPLRRLFHKLLHFWDLARRLPSEQQFSEGEAINYAGLLFVLDPRDDSLIHIAIPLDDFDPSEIPEMMREAREMFIEFVRQRPSLERLAEQRALQIRVVASYDRFEEEIGPRVRIDHWFDGSCTRSLAN